MAVSIATGKKATAATVKAFIRKHFADGTLLIWEKSRFDGMVDCVMETAQGGFYKAVAADVRWTNNLGVQNVWFVETRGGDHVRNYEECGVIGYEVSNCCGRWIVAIQKKYL